MKRSIFTLLLWMFAVNISMAQSPAYRGNIDTGYSFGIGDHSTPQWLINTSHGVEFIPDRLFVGGGVGLGISTESEREAYSVPIFAEARYTFGSRRVKPFADLRAGYGLLWDKSHPGGNEGGFYFSPSAGVSIPVASGTCINFSLGYTIHRAHYNLTKTNHINYNAGGLNLKAGVTF